MFFTRNGLPTPLINVVCLFGGKSLVSEFSVKCVGLFKSVQTQKLKFSSMICSDTHADTC